MRATRGQIIDSALQRVGNTTATLIQAARIRLNRILQELHQGWDWPFLWSFAPDLTIAPTGVISPLPSDFLKPEDTQSLTVTAVGGRPALYILPEVDHRTFYARHPDAQATVPTIWTMDYSVWRLGGQAPQTIPLGLAWPRPYETCAARLRYKFLPLDFPLDNLADYDADIPLFPWDLLLSDLLFEWAQQYEVDPRRGDQYSVNAEAVARARGASFPERSYPSQVPLDPLVFGRPWPGND